MENKCFNIKYVSEQTGLTTHVIRIWERRYSAVSPERAENNRRLYSVDDIEKLKLLKIATSSGQSIGQIANFDLSELREIAQIKAPNGNNVQLLFDPNDNDYVERSLSAIENFNSYELQKILRQATADLGNFRLLKELISPLMDLIGEKWRSGDLNPSKEHFATEIIKNYLNSIVLRSNTNNNAPVIIVTTPKGQLHDIGATIVSFAAMLEGYHVLYLGANLDYNEITSAILNNNAKAVALSIVHPNDDIFLNDELVNLRKNLDESFPVIIGGRASFNYLNTINEINAYHTSDLDEFRETLVKIRE